MIYQRKRLLAYEIIICWFN